MNKWLLFLLLTLCATLLDAADTASISPAPKRVYILPIRDDISKPLVYVVRRGVKEAMEAKADVLVIDMKTNGGRGDAMMDIIEILDQFKGDTVTYVNREAFSAGALISFATRRIFMAPDAVIGAAAPVMASAEGGASAMPDTMEAKSASAIAAMIRARADRNGHNPEIVDAMIRKTKELTIDNVKLNEKGAVLTLNNKEAERLFGNPAKPLLSAGTVETLDALIEKVAGAGAIRVRIESSGWEQLGSWLNAISPILLILGIAGVYLEFKSPGFGLPGTIGILAFALYFFGGYVAGLSGMGWIMVFFLGVGLVALELFAFPGTLALGITGVACMFASLIMAMVDFYPGMPAMPTMKQLSLPMNDLLIASAGAAVVIWLMSLWLPKTLYWQRMVTQSASGAQSDQLLERQQSARIGQVGVTVSPLHPGGKARFGDEILDVIAQGETIEKGRPVRIIGNSGHEAVVEVAS
jgi:membrane-bound serine protease (ClpP class)